MALLNLDLAAVYNNPTPLPQVTSRRNPGGVAVTVLKPNCNVAADFSGFAKRSVVGSPDVAMALAKYRAPKSIVRTVAFGVSVTAINAA